MLVGDPPCRGTRDSSVGRCPAQAVGEWIWKPLEAMDEPLLPVVVEPEQAELTEGDADPGVVRFLADLDRLDVEVNRDLERDSARQVPVEGPFLDLLLKLHYDDHPEALCHRERVRRYNIRERKTALGRGGPIEYPIRQSDFINTALWGARLLIWLGFLLAVVLLLIVSRRNLALGMAFATAVLAAFTLSWPQVGEALLRTISDPSVLLLALVVGVIPLIGGVMEASGQMERLVSNLRIGVRPFLASAPALLGMLPMPGGALLSAPLIERGASHIPADVKAAANVWFRHVLLIVYPLGSALIASAKIAELDVYEVIPFLIPAFLLSVGVGYLFLLRRAGGRLAQHGAFSLIGLLVPLGIILAAPGIDLALKRTFALPVAEIGTASGVFVSLILATAVGRIRLPQLRRIFVKMRPWKYALIVLAMFAFLNVFTASGVPERIAAMTLHPVALCVVIGFVLGLVTGRIQAPMSIVVPIYVSTYRPMTPEVFAVTYFAIFLGYVLTPIHPCVSVSVEYFGTPMSAFLQRLAVPAVVSVIVTLIVGLFVL